MDEHTGSREGHHTLYTEKYRVSYIMHMEEINHRKAAVYIMTATQHHS